MITTTRKETAKLLRIALEQAIRLSDNENVYGDRDDQGHEQSASVEYFKEYIEQLERKQSAPYVEEGYYTIESKEDSVDCDHGPCNGINLDNGWIVWTYPEKPDLISFHPNFTREK